MANDERPSRKLVKKSESPFAGAKERLRNALITGTAGGYLGGMLIEGKTRVKVPDFTRRLLRMKRKTIGVHGARTGAAVGAAVGASNRGKRSETVDSVATGGDWKFSAYIEDMTFGSLPKEVQKDVQRFVTAEKGTPVVHYGMTVKELIGKADPENLKAARKALGTLRASKAADEVISRTKDGSKYVLLMNDRIVDGHHFLAKAERGGVTSSLNVLDLTPARLGTKAGGCGCQMADGAAVTQFEEEKKKSGWKRKAAIAAGATAGAVLGARTLPRLIRRGRPLKEGEELAGKVLYTHEGLTTPASVVNIGGKTLRRRLEKKALKGSKLAGAALKVDDFLGIPQRHYGIGAGGGRVIEKTKAHGHRMVSKEGFARGNRVQVDSDTLPKDSSKWGEWAKGMEKRNEAAQGKAKRGDLCLIGNNCEHHARDIAGQGRKSYQSRAIVGGAVGGAAAGGAAVGTMTKRKREEKQMSVNVNAMLLHLFEEARERRSRVRDLRDKIGLVKDTAGLAGVTAAGVGGVKLYRAAKGAIQRVEPQMRDAATGVKEAVDGWKKTAATTNENVQRVGRLAGNLERRLDAPKRKAMIESRMKLRNEKRKAAGKSSSNLSKAMQGKGVKAPKMAVGLIQRLMLNDPRLVRTFARKQPAVVVQPPQRDGWQKARDGALIAGGAAAVGAAGYTAHKAGKAIKGLAKRGRVALRQVPQVTDNVQNATSISADMGRVYRKARKVITDSVAAYKEGQAAAEAAPTPKWAKRAVKIGKKLRLLASRVPSFKFQVSSSKEQEQELENERLAGWRKREYLAAGADKVGQAGGLVAGVKGSMRILKKAPRDTFTFPKMPKVKGVPDLSGLKMDMGPKKGYAIAAGVLPVVAQLAGGKIAEKLARKAHEKMTPKDKQPVMGKTKSALAKAYAEGGTMSYPLHAAGGAGLALAGGGLLKGRRGVNRKVAGVGAAAALLARALKQKKINRAEDEELNTPKLHKRPTKVVGAVGRNIKDNLLPAMGMGLGAAGIVKARPGLMKWAGKMARRRDVMGRRRNPAKPDKMVARRKGPLIDADTGLPVRALPEKRMHSRQALNEFILGALGTIAGTLAGSAAGAKFRYPVQNALKKRLVPKLGKTWGKRVARAGSFAPENAGALAGGAAGSFLTEGMRKRKEEEDGSQFSVRGSQLNQLVWRALREFGGREQLKDIDSSSFLDPLDVFIGRKKGYTAEQVKDYNRQRRYIEDVRSGKRKGTPEAIKAAEDLMRNVRGNPTKAAHGQVIRSALRKGDTVRKVAERSGGLLKDAAKELRGEGREKDRWGREKKREWEKPWFSRTKNQVLGAAALGGGAMALRKFPKVRAKMDRLIRVGQRKVNEYAPDLFPGVKPLRKKGQKTLATVHAKRQQAAQAKAAKTQAMVNQAGQNIAQQAAAVKPAAASPAPAPKPAAAAPKPAPKPAATPAPKPADKSVRAPVSKSPVSKSSPPPVSSSPVGGSPWGQSKLVNEAPVKAASKPKKPRKDPPGTVKQFNRSIVEALRGRWRALTQFEKPFAGYNPKRHARTGGLNDSFRTSYNREHGSNLKRPVTTPPSKLKPGSEAAGRRKSFCARMSGMQGPTSKGGKLTPKGAALRRWNCMAIQALTQFADPLDVGWDIRDARGNSARVFAPHAGQRDRRPKKWHERVENERKLWAGAALTSTLAGGAAMRKLLGKQTKQAVDAAVKAERAKVRGALQKVRKMREARKSNLVPFTPHVLPKDPPRAA